MIFITFLLAFSNVFANNNEAMEYRPVNVEGYVYNTNSNVPRNSYTSSFIESRPQLKTNIDIIQQKYSAFLPFMEEDAYDIASIYHEDKPNQNTVSYKFNTTPVVPVEISTDIAAKLCTDMGHNQTSQRDSMKFHSCIADIMKIKFTEETLSHTKHLVIDSNIVNAMKNHTFVDNSVQNLVRYQEMLSHRNKMDCIKSLDYHQCISATIQYKQCYNKNYESIIAEHEQNKVICYIKTGLRFTDTNMQDFEARDSYFGVCMHLVEKTMQSKINEMNAKCNQILTNNNLLDLSI